MLMAEGNRLLALDALVGGHRRADHAADHPENERYDEDRPEDRDAGESVGRTVENLRHCGAGDHIGIER